MLPPQEITTMQFACELVDETASPKPQPQPQPRNINQFYFPSPLHSFIRGKLPASNSASGILQVW